MIAVVQLVGLFAAWQTLVNVIILLKHLHQHHLHHWQHHRHHWHHQHHLNNNYLVFTKTLIVATMQLNINFLLSELQLSPSWGYFLVQPSSAWADRVNICILRLISSELWLVTSLKIKYIFFVLCSKDMIRSSDLIALRDAACIFFLYHHALYAYKAKSLQW